MLSFDEGAKNLVNWKSLGFGIFVTLILILPINYLPIWYIILPPIIGGIIIGDRVAGSYKTGIIYGGLSAGIAMFIYNLPYFYFTRGTNEMAWIAQHFPHASYIESGIIFLIINLLTVIQLALIYFTLGLLGGFIGTIIKEKDETPIPNKQQQ